MDGPGLSLFQGSESIQLNASMQRLEEDEELEDIKRRNEEIKDLLTNAFDDLDGDASSVNSSHYHDSTRESNHTNTMINTSSQVSSKCPQTISQYHKEFGIYDHIGKSNSDDHNAISNHRIEPDDRPSISDIQRDFDLYGHTETSYGKSNRTSDVDNTNTEMPYEVSRPPNARFPCDLRDPVDTECTFNDNYVYNFETPSNHYDGQSKKYSNNGYIDGYENNISYKQIDEFGGGDNVTSDHVNHCYKISPNGKPMSDNMAYKTAEYESKEQLEVLYSVRMREIKTLTEEIQQLQLEKEEEKNQLSRKLALVQAEVERSNVSRNQAQRALVDAKAEISKLESQVISLKETNSVLEKSNKNISEELCIAKDSVADLQQKISVLERVQALQSNDKTYEKFLKQAQEKHAVEIKNMQTQIDVLTQKLNEKESSYVTLENQLIDVRRAHETLMLEKSDTMKRLAKALEESQTQCCNLMSTNSAQHVIELQAQLKMLTQEKEEMQKSIQELQNKLELAKNDVAQYDSLLATTLEDESDSIRQMKLGDIHNKSRSKPCDDITNKLRGELQRCLAGQAVKRKEINRLENTLSQKEKELEKALAVTDSCRQEASRYAKRVNELEQELKSLLTDQAMKANAQIQKLCGHLNDVRKQCDSLREEKISLEQKLEESIAINHETLMKIHQESVNQQKEESVNEYNKQYLEIHAEAVERVRQEANVEIVQLNVQLEQTQKELDHIKQLYIDVCGTKEELINEHNNQIKLLKDNYASAEAQQKNVEKLEQDIQAQVKVIQKLTKDCEKYRSKIVELEKDLHYERKKKEEYTRKIHQEIERAKEEALSELRHAHPNQQISLLLPDHCSEHLEKINQLEEDCRRLEEKLHAAVEEHAKISEYQTNLDDARIKMAQMEISQESWKKKYDNIISERNELLMKISKIDGELSQLKKNAKIDESNDIKSKISNLEAENETLKAKCDQLISEKNSYKDQISQLESELCETKSIITDLESRLTRGTDNSRCESEKEIAQYKELVVQLTNKLSNLKERKKNDFVLEQKVKELEMDLREKDEQLEKLKDIEKIREERDDLVIKLKNQAKQFEQYVKNQKQISAELNLSPRSSNDGTDFHKIREIMIKEVREEMEQKVVEELRNIEEQHREKRKELEERYKSVLLELQARCKEKTQEVESLKEAIVNEKVKIHSSFKAKEQFVSQVIESKLETYYQELLARKLKIKKLQEELKQKENDVEEERNLMTQVMTKWVTEIKEIKAKEIEMNDEIQKLKENEESLKAEMKVLQEKEKEMKSNIDTLKHKYQSAKKIANNYKEHAENKEKFLLSECKRIKEGYKRAMNQVQQKLDEIVNSQEEQVASKLKELECHYAERMEQMRLTLKYKNKC